MNLKLFKRIGIAYLVGLFGIMMAIQVADFLGSDTAVNKNLTQGLIFTGIIIPAFWIIRNRIDRRKPTNIGLGTLKSAALNFLIGLLPILIPFILTISSIELFNWGEVAINAPKNNLFVSHLLAVLLFEAFPEEFLFRGYIYSNLNLAFSKRKAFLITVVLFSAFPLILVLVNQLLDLEFTLGGSSNIRLEYFVTLLVFGSMVQYLRILTNSIWTSIGFHLFFVYLNRLVGPKETNIIQIVDLTDEGPIRIVLIVSVLVVFAGLILYPNLTRRKIKRKEKLKS